MTALDITVGWGNGAIRAVQMRSDRPQPSRMLAGLEPATALALLSRLYAICGRAQSACAELALAAAGGTALSAARRTQLARGIAAEAAQEHLWRLLLDWPTALALAPHQAEFKRWYGRIAADAILWPAELRAELELDWLGLPLERLAAFADLAQFDAWRRGGHAPLATLFARLGAEPASSSMAPGSTLPTECGCALATSAEHPWVAALGAAGRWLEAHVAARLVGLAAVLAAVGDGAAVEMDAATPAPGRGVALVATARGMLEHDVTVSGGRVDRYAITTPTDCNFAADGPFAGRLCGCPAATPQAARRAAELWALAFDPCVAYSVSLGEPGHA
jgi:hypothetical protein